jgi:acyl-CoA thioesterase YciA
MLRCVRPFPLVKFGLVLKCAVEQRLARQAHNLEVVGSIPTGATFRSFPPHPFMAESQANDGETLAHHLVLPRDANHHGTLYAGVLVSLALEAGYATAFRAAGLNANLVLKRVLDLRCYEPVPVGRVVQIRGREIHRARAHIVVGLVGVSQADQASPWMDSLMQFVQVDAGGRPVALDEEPEDESLVLDLPWFSLRERARKLLQIRQ